MLEAATLRHRILVTRDRIAIPPPGGAPARPEAVATVAANLTSYGYALSAEAAVAFAALDDAGLARWWSELEPVLAGITGADRKMEQFVVYKNFPAEVLAMDDAAYWTRQILMYWGVPAAWVTQPAAPRPDMTERPTLKALQLATPRTLHEIGDALLAHRTRWLDAQWEDLQFLVERLDRHIDLDGVPFVENRIRLAAHLLERGATARVGNATDVLRLAAALSGGDLSLRTPTKLRTFKRRERRYLLGLLEGAAQLDEDLARRPELAKRLLRALRPGDYRDDHPRVVAAYDRIYNDRPEPTFNVAVEAAIARRDPEALGLLRQRPGELMRRLHAMLLMFGPDAARAFTDVVGKLSTLQLVKLHKYLETVNDRTTRMFPPQGNWQKVQIVDALPGRKVPGALRGDLLGAIAGELQRRFAATGPFAVASQVARVKLPSNDDELGPFARGTVFPIPANIQFVRTATYWKMPGSSSSWFDNGWNFHDAAWTPVGVCAWNVTRFGDAAVFSGDPVNKHELEGRACQLIDLYLDKLAAAGVRYAVWTVLCFSKVAFAKAQEVLAALQWGERAEEGTLFHPARVQLAFPIRGESLTKFVAMIDLERRELTYLDANLPARVSSAAANGKLLKRNMPAFVEYLGSLPSVADLLAHAPQDPRGVPVVYDDATVPITAERAYVFRPTNEASKFQPFDLTKLL